MARAPTLSAAPRPLVQRSTVPAGKPYGEYLASLKKDFWWSCAYCTMTEAEAMAIRFVIDHYEPRWKRPDLLNDYSNLMYSCDECNLRKGDLVPPDVARSQGVRFFRPDTDHREDHFELSDIRLNSKTTIGEFTIDAADLNRAALRKLRDIRRRLTQCEEMVAGGVLALRRFHTDQLPPEIKRRAVTSIQQAISFADGAAAEIDAILEDYAKSPVLGQNDAVEQGKMAMGEWRRLYPGNWRAPRTPKNRRK